MAKHILISVAVAVLLSAGALGLVARRSDKALVQQRPDPRSETLRSMAQKSGSAKATARPTNLRRYDSVDALARDSNTVVIGSVDSKTSGLLPPAEKLIVTDFQITVRDSLKGTLVPGKTIKLRTPGGRVDFVDGKYAQVKMPEFWKYPEVGKVYILFLESRPDETFVLRGGPQGMFEFSPEGGVRAQVRPEDELTQKYNGVSSESFLEEIRQAGKSELRSW